VTVIKGNLTVTTGLLSHAKVLLALAARILAGEQEVFLLVKSSLAGLWSNTQSSRLMK